jgi:putative tricarboxylic transport membrane protein
MSEGFMQALWMFGSWQVAAGLLAGVVVGYLVGALPGLSASMGMALLIPFTFGLSPVVSIVMLVTLYMAAEYSGAIPAILCNTPGEPSAAITALDGYPMRERGEAGHALTLSILGSAFGSIVSTALLIVTAQSIAAFALAFGPADYFALAVLGLSLISCLAGNSLLRGGIGLLLGLQLTMIGIDPVDGTTRYVVTPGLLSGISLIAALIGLFALSEVLEMLETSSKAPQPLQQMPRLTGQFSLLLPHRWVLLRSTLIGFVIGVVPGAGATIASLTAYVTEKRLSNDPDSFGKGNPAGVVASETANNACIPGALAPMLALGLPSKASVAILISALTIHGVQPGPLIFTKHPEIPYAIYIALFIGMPIMVVLGLWGARLWVRLTLIPTSVVAVLVAAICLLGTYAESGDLFTVYTAIAFGIAGYLLRKAGIGPTPIVLALVLGYMMESNFRRAMLQSGGDPAVFITSPIAAVCLALAALVLVVPIVQDVRRGARQRDDARVGAS